MELWVSTQLEAIAFNHDPGSATSDALNIRRHGTDPLMVPEWRRGVSHAPEDSMAAYALRETRGQAITIQANFSRDDPSLTTVEIRAVDPSLPGLLSAWLESLLALPEPWPAQYSSWYFYYFWQIAAASIGNVIGEVQPATVTFGSNGETGFQTFRLSYPPIYSRGVGVHTVRWRWQFRRNTAGPWTDFANSAHRIYTILDVPTAPWLQQPFHPANMQLPWTEVLDYACRWARGARTPDDAAVAVTQRVYALGPELLEYGCPILGLTEYAMPEGYFNCTAFLDRLRGGIGNGRYLNCTDCATIVSTFGNSLGCDLSQARMGMVAPFFAMNPVLAIGSNLWQPACGLPGFYYHEVAWKGACTANDEVFDACLLVDRDVNPSGAPHLPLLPANMRFGEPGEGGYCDRLAAPQSRHLCAPQPVTRQRRLVF